MLLRPLMAQDAPRMLEWMHDENVTRYLRINGADATLQDAQDFIASTADESRNLHRAIVNDKDEYLGTISLKNIDRKKLEAEYAIAMHSSAIGTGAAFWGSGEIFKIAFEELQLNRVYLNVLAENQRAVRFYQKLSSLGLEPEGQTMTEINGVQKPLLWFAVRRNT